MGQKVNPHGLRVGVIKDWDSKWYADAEFSDYLVEDYNTGLSSVDDNLNSVRCSFDLNLRNTCAV